VQAIDAAFDGGNNKIDADPTLAKMAASVSLSSAGIDGMADVRNSVKTLAYYLMQSGQAKTPDDAVTKSTQWINDKYDFVGMTRVPKGLGDAFETVAQNTLDGLKPSDIAQTYQKLPYLEANEEASYTRAAKNGVWVTNGNDDGAVLMGNFGNGVFLPIMRAGKDSSGKPQPVQIKFSDVPTMRNAIRIAPADVSAIPELGSAPSDAPAMAGTE
jgi:hypothetical protein